MFLLRKENIEREVYRVVKRGIREWDLRRRN